MFASETLNNILTIFKVEKQLAQPQNIFNSNYATLLNHIYCSKIIVWQDRLHSNNAILLNHIYGSKIIVWQDRLQSNNAILLNHIYGSKIIVWQDRKKERLGLTN